MTEGSRKTLPSVRDVAWMCVVKCKNTERHVRWTIAGDREARTWRDVHKWYSDFFYVCGSCGEFPVDYFVWWLVCKNGKKKLSARGHCTEPVADGEAHDKERFVQSLKEFRAHRPSTGCCDARQIWEITKIALRVPRASQRAVQIRQHQCHAC